MAALPATKGLPPRANPQYGILYIVVGLKLSQYCVFVAETLHPFVYLSNHVELVFQLPFLRVGSSLTSDPPVHRSRCQPMPPADQSEVIYSFALIHNLFFEHRVMSALRCNTFPAQRYQLTRLPPIELRTKG